MVYIHAGEFRFGTSEDSESDWPWFAGFSNASVLLVTLNSRLGLTGSAHRSSAVLVLPGVRHPPRTKPHVCAVPPPCARARAWVRGCV